MDSANEKRRYMVTPPPIDQTHTKNNPCALDTESFSPCRPWWDNFHTLQWRHNARDGVSNQRGLDGLLNRLSRHRSKKTSKLRVTGLCEGNIPVTGDFTHKLPVTRKMFPFDDVIMITGPSLGNPPVIDRFPYKRESNVGQAVEQTVDWPVICRCNEDGFR